jgi:hypothetical protein
MAKVVSALVEAVRGMEMMLKGVVAWEPTFL